MGTRTNISGGNTLRAAMWLHLEVLAAVGTHKILRIHLIYCSAPNGTIPVSWDHRVQAQAICAVTKTNLGTLFPGSATEMIGLTNSDAAFTWSGTTQITDTPSHLSIFFLVFSFVILYLWWFLVNIFSHKFSIPFILFLYYSIPLCSWFTHQFLTIVPMKKEHLFDHFFFFFWGDGFIDLFLL